MADQSNEIGLFEFPGLMPSENTMQSLAAECTAVAAASWDCLPDFSKTELSHAYKLTNSNGLELIARFRQSRMRTTDVEKQHRLPSRVECDFRSIDDGFTIINRLDFQPCLALNWDATVNAFVCEPVRFTNLGVTGNSTACMQWLTLWKLAGVRLKLIK